MLHETYLANLKNIPKNAMRIRVARPSILAPSKKLLDDWKGSKIDWKQYEHRYRLEIASNNEAINMLFMIKGWAELRDVYIYCYEKNPPCHRFIIMEIIKEWSRTFPTAS